MQNNELFPNVDDAAAAAYTDLYSQWIDATNTNWWGNGNVFDTLMDYMLLTNQSAADIEQLAFEGLEVYFRSNGMWYDDYGWWGIAATKGFIQTNGIYKLGKAAPIYQAMAQQTFAFMNARAPQVWEFYKELHNGTPPTTYKPRYDGGVWNFILDENKVPSLDVPQHVYDPNLTQVGNPPFPTTNSLTSRQNSVTNGLYLVLGSRLRNYLPDIDYNAFIDPTAGFLDNWFNDPDKDQRLMYAIDANSVLIRERVGGFKSGIADPDFNYEVAWAGDQGLFLSALIDYRSSKGKLLTLNFTPENIINGVFNAMLVAEHPSGKMQLNNYKYDRANGISPMENWDYTCGSGVFMRYLTYAFSKDPNVRSAMTAERIEIIYNTAPNPPFVGGNNIFKALDSLAAYNFLLLLQKGDTPE